MVDAVSVGLSDIKVVKAGKNLRSSGLGSCVGLVLYDAIKGIAGMAHIMLPDSEISRGKSFSPGKFADTAVPELLRQLQLSGASREHLRAKMAGGAEMFKALNGWTANIGLRNVQAIEEQLKTHQLDLLSADVGGNYGRSIVFDVETEKLHIHTVTIGDKVI